MSMEMDENQGAPRRGPRGAGQGGADKKGGSSVRKRGFTRRKVCRFCADKTLVIDYKDPQLLKYFCDRPRQDCSASHLGNCAKHQRKVALSVRRSRMIALCPTP